MALTITENAAEEVRKAIGAMHLEEDTTHLRIFITSAGCSGLAYGLTFVAANDLKEDDIVSELTGLKVVTDPKSAVLLEETTVDYFSGEDKQGFTFTDNTPSTPSSCGSCGCGKKSCG